ncbi:MAG TPA: TetR/AcrR family transcriptional regulator [Deltaproteobacteria bacterium]|nr:TetR/AcrR family transcriptional regulator [Deltaproteobacteria bacterium]
MQQKKKPTPRRRGTNRREEILKAARELFLKNGYSLSTVEQIARHAGYSKRSVYLDFPKKDDLFITICNEGLFIVRDQLLQIPLGIGFEDYITRYLETIAVFSHQHAGFFRMLTADVTPEIIANCSPEVRTQAMEIESAGIRLLAEAVERAMRSGLVPEGDAWEVAELFIGSVVGIIMLSMGGSQAMLSYDKMKLKVRKLGEIACRGLIRSGRR